MAVCNTCDITHECEQYENYNGEVDNRISFDKCRKNPGHTKFLSVCDLTKADVPLEFQSDEGMSIIKEICQRTVKLRVSYISTDRFDTWYGGVPFPLSQYKGSHRITSFGTGVICNIIMFKDQRCECKECQNSTNPVIGCMEVWVNTARHVVFDESEANKTTVELFYDKPDKEGVVLFDGCYSSWNSRIGPDYDRIKVFCYTHDKDVMDKLIHTVGLEDSWNNNKYRDFKTGFCVSHPHGLHKQISFGQTSFIVYFISKDHFTEHKGFVRCRLKRSVTSKKDYKKLETVTNPSMVEPGVDYLLPDTSNICVCSGYRSDVDEWRYVVVGGDVEWHDIPEGVGYKDSSNGKFVPFPPGMEILCKLENLITVTYDTPTCPGSSGALVYNYGIGGVGLTQPDCVHSGAIDKVWGNLGFHGYY